MPRLPKHGSRMNKVKIGTTVEPMTKGLIEELQLMFPDEARSTGEAIDLMFGLMMGLNPRDAAALERFCAERARALAEELDARFAKDGSEEFCREAVRLRIDRLRDLARFFAGFGDAPVPSDGVPR